MSLHSGSDVSELTALSDRTIGAFMVALIQWETCETLTALEHLKVSVSDEKSPTRCELHRIINDNTNMCN